MIARLPFAARERYHRPMRSSLSVVALALLFLGCSSARYRATSAAVDLPRFMGRWYVWAGRTTFMEKGAHNAVETYAWNAGKKRIDIDFKFRRDAFEGKLKTMPQKGWVVDGTGNARWKISPLWPLKFDYLILAVGPEYAWTAIGVPDGSYLWIMGREPAVSDEKLAAVIAEVAASGYPVDSVSRVPQRW